QINSVTTMTQNGDTLLILYPQLNQIALITNSTDPDSLFLDNAYFVDASGVQNIQYLQNKINGYRLFLIEKQEQIDVYTISDSGFIDYAKTWEFIWSIQSVSVKDSLLFLGTSKNQLLVYDIASDFELIYKTNINLTGNAVKSIVLNNRLLVFEWNKMYVIDVTDNDNISVEYDISLPLPVLDAAYYDNQLFTVGPDGINVFDWSQPEPVLIDYGGLGGNIIAAGNNLLAVSDGNGVHVYYLDSLSGIILATPDDEIIPFQFNLTQNFPNPFNLETIIKYTIPKTAQVELSVFNILGQKVKTLVNDIKPAGEFNAYWNGSNHDGTTVSTGVYFYRLAVEDYIETKKMILLK
ncbi:MAG: T9SS type A sorting domain-containing protein, partial [Candidatus Zixiibacteriota bacterium]